MGHRSVTISTVKTKWEIQSALSFTNANIIKKKKKALLRRTHVGKSMLISRLIYGPVRVFLNICSLVRKESGGWVHFPKLCVHHLHSGDPERIISYLEKWLRETAPNPYYIGDDTNSKAWGKDYSVSNISPE